MDAGQLATRLVLMQAIDTPDDQGGFTRSWHDADILWALVEPARAGFAMDAGRGVSRAHYRVLIREGMDISPRDRLRMGSQPLAIEAISIQDAGRFLRLDCVEIID